MSEINTTDDIYILLDDRDELITDKRYEVMQRKARILSGFSCSRARRAARYKLMETYKRIQESESKPLSRLHVVLYEFAY